MAFTYENGRVPRHLLVERDGALFFPGTAIKYDRLIEIGLRKRGRRYCVTGPDDAYRLYEVQVEYKSIYGPKAAAPGYSSHGGTFPDEELGRTIEAGAVDIGNWEWVAGSYEAFAEDAREAGFEPGYFMGQYGRPVEEWHLIDRSPWYIPPTPTPLPEEEEMALISWNGRVWSVYKETCAYIQDGAAVSAGTKISGRGVQDLSNEELTRALQFLGIPWAALDATYNGRAFDNESNWGRGNFWSRQMAEGREDLLRDQRLAKSIEALARAVK